MAESTIGCTKPIRSRVAGDDVGAAEGVERGLGGRRVQPGELGGGARPGALAEDRDRLGQRGRIGREPLEALQHDGGDRLGAERAHRGGLLLGGLQPLVRDLVQELGHEERVAAGGLVAGAAEAVGGAVVDGVADPVADGVAAQRGGAEHPRGGVGDDRAQAVGLLLGARAGADQQRDREVFEAAQQEAEEVQARLVRPLGVVDADDERLLGGEVRAQPVQAVQAGVGGLLGVLGEVEDRLGEARRAR